MTNPDITDAPADTSPSAALAPAEGLPQPSSSGATAAGHPSVDAHSPGAGGGLTMRRAASGSPRTGSTPSAPRSPRPKARSPIPTKGAVNPHFKSQYADLSAGLNAVRAALSANGIAIVQTTRMEGDVLMLFTALAHASGQWIGSEWPVAKFPLRLR